MNRLKSGNEVQVCDVVKNNSLVKEVEATVNIGSVLGIDLEGHEGLGGLDKVPWLHKLKLVNGVDFLAVQETKAEVLSSFLGKSIWGNNNYGMEVVGSVGQSGGILSLWDKDRFLLCDSIKSQHFLLVSGSEVGNLDPPDIVLLKKFGRIRASINRWKEEMVMNENVAEEEAKEEVDRLEVVMETRSLTEEEEWIYAECKKELKEAVYGGVSCPSEVSLSKF
ncbi:RNA-directed DNA polymerase, eukaryota [Artemisia annua]|uniref:RNA-directed DNA polymerase, eukaryota n=1 Tax=Artemisia annua TaxID=35608 RepID=A0A2U1KK87_ARTAN|nr:RNA-directed DNA polymerase, eukaryota [Artemisia annua]